jgi:hypothetical protein
VRLFYACAGVLFSLAALSCGGSTPMTEGPPANEPEPAPPPGSPAVDDARGGRLFDSWTTEAGSERPADGAVRFGDGRVLTNEAGHDYRLKNLFGWDLRGNEGIYGPSYMAKPYVLGTNPLSWTGDAAAIADRLERGDAQVPAFGAVIQRADLEAIAAFITGVRDRRLPHPEGIFALTSRDAGHYALREGGDPERGRAMFAAQCANCHGSDGTGVLFDDGEFSLGSHARQKAYEDWMKILNGQPGAPMQRQVRGTGAEMTQQILDVLAALCDRTRFPRGAATGADVPDGDPRCGAYLR